MPLIERRVGERVEVTRLASISPADGPRLAKGLGILPKASSSPSLFLPCGLSCIRGVSDRRLFRPPQRLQADGWTVGAKGRILGREHDPAWAGSNDAELLRRLRGGESDAYTELWRRHIQPALKLAGRLAPGRADDLASESFLAVYHQVTVAGNGPESMFRAYLFTTMRNIAMRWRKETDLVETDPDLDSIELEDGLSALIDRNRSAEMLAAFQALPERWQRVLWLTEVEGVPRPEIAAEFGIKPNAVSVLYRRARTGLRLQWLAQQIPPALRDSSEHVARLLPQLVLEGGSPDRRIAEHLRECGTCANLDRELRSSARGMQRTTLGALGFAALGVALPAASQLSATAIGAGAATALLALGGVTLAASLGAFIIVGAPPILPAEQPAHSGQEATSSQSGGRSDPGPVEARDKGADGASADAEGDSPAGQVLGRGNTDPAVPAMTVDMGALPDDYYVTPSPQQPLPPGSVPGPMPAGSTPDSELRSGIETPLVSTGYLAPVLSGTTEPGAEVAVELRSLATEANSFTDPRLYAATVAENGDWVFDTPLLFSNQVGEFEFRVWAHTDEASSPADVGSFTITPPQVNGASIIASSESIPLSEASDTGYVYLITGPSNGTVCLTSVFPGQAFQIPLDENGEAIRRIRFTTAGWYYLTFRVCEGERRGTAAEVYVDVVDPDGPIFGPWGPDPADTVIEVSEP